MFKRTRLPALRYRDFRHLWIGQLFSSIGSQMQLIAINWNVYLLLRHQSIAIAVWQWHFSLGAQAVGLGTLGAVRIVPILFFAFLGGVLADYWDHRSIIIVTQAIAGLCTVVLGLLALHGSASIVFLYVFTAIDAMISAFNEPAQNALFPELVPHEDLANATTLFAIIWQIGTVVGPLLAGVLLTTVNIGVVYLINACSFFLVVVAAFSIRHRGRKIVASEPFVWREMLEGLHLARRTQMIWSTMLLDSAATFFASARTMLPLVADQILHAGVQGYGLLATAQPVGAILTGLVLAWRKPIERQGVVLLVSVAIYGLATALFGVSVLFPLSYLLFALTGVGDTLSDVIRSTIRQYCTPVPLRGRLAAVQMMLAFGGPQLGEVESGLLAALLGVSVTIFAGGLITCLFVGWIAYRYPLLRQYVHPDVQD